MKVRRLEEVAQRNEEELSALSVDGKPVLLPSTTTANPETGCENLQFGFRSGRSGSDWIFSPRFREFHAVQFRVVDDRRQQLECHPERDLGAEGPAGRDRPGAAEDEQHPQVSEAANM